MVIWYDGALEWDKVTIPAGDDWIDEPVIVNWCEKNLNGRFTTYGSRSTLWLLIEDKDDYILAGLKWG